MMQDNHIFQGMRRDNHPIRQDKQFLWDAHNIRLTTRDDNTMLSITNEKSTREVISFDKDESYIGHVTIGDYLILLTTKTKEDRIYRISLDTKTKIILYKGNLNFNSEYPAQMLSDYESELIQKVYWIDGYNCPRVINIAKPELLSADYNIDEGYTSVYSDAPFDFVQDLSLNENVAITRLFGSTGIFPAGVIQYAFTYYHKYGQESNIFYTSEPLYISHSERGGSPEDNINTAFKLTITNPQNDKFQYLRIYSIARTSIDAVPTVKRVADIELDESEVIEYTDNGTIGDIVDPTMLLYLGGKDIVAGCIAAKDNTLFLGDIKYNRREVSVINGLEDNVKQLQIECNKREVESIIDSNNSVYKYHNQLATNTSTFKVGEVYRLGVQFQYKNGEWSEPLFIDDKLMNNVNPSINNKNLSLPIFRTTINNTIKEALGNDYIKVRPVVVLPETKDKNILAQGIICPTVFNAGARESNSPFAQSSWLLRPFSIYNPSSNNIVDASGGALAEFRHYQPLLSGFNRGAEIQNMFIESEGNSDSEVPLNKQDNYNYSLDNTKAEVNKTEDKDYSYKSLYYVDQSVLTFHSPDIEFNDKVVSAINNNPSLNIKLVGVVPFNANAGDIDIQTSSVVMDPDASGFIHRNILNTSDGGKSLISGLFYEDSFVCDKYDSDTLVFYNTEKIRPWMTYLWHRSGSLNNDCVRPEDTGARSAVLKKKRISNIKFSKDSLWLNTPKNLNTSEIQLFNSNEISLLKIKDAYNKIGDITYYGNVDSLNSSYSKFRLVYGETVEYQLKEITKEFSGTIATYTSQGAIEQRIKVRVHLNYGNKTTGAISGYIVDHTNINIPIEEDGEITSTSVDLFNAAFDATIDYRDNYKLWSYRGFITVKDEYNNETVYSINGATDYKIDIKNRDAKDSFNFNGSLAAIDPYTSKALNFIKQDIGQYQTALKLPKDAVRIKYKSTPHLVFATSYNSDNFRTPLPVISGTETKIVNANSIYWQSNIANSSKLITPESINFSELGINYCPSSYLWLAEVRQTVDEDTRFGGKSKEALQNNLWIPAGPAVRLDSNESIEWQWGDTWYQRYDCLKTYPFTKEDENQVVEIGSFMCETRINIDGRYDRNRGNISNLDVSPINFNLFNSVYSQKNTFFNYRILDSDYYKLSRYQSQLMWTGVKSPGAIQDSWTNLHMASSLDMDGSNGRLVSIVPFNDILVGFQETGVSQIMFNSRIQVQASDGVPIEITNNQRVDGVRPYSNSIGCQDKFAIVDSATGVYFMDNNNHSLYKFNGQIIDISLQLGTLFWARENAWDTTWKYNDQGPLSNGIRLSYDPKYQDIYFTPGADNKERDALCFSEQLGQFTSFLSYGGAVMFPYKSRFYSIAPNLNGVMTLWENFPPDSNSYNYIFGIPRDYSFSFISNDNPTITKVFDTIEMRADCYIPNNDRDDNFGLLGNDLTHVNQTGKPFNLIRVDNEYQDTGEVILDSATMRKKFRIWRALIPRKKGSRERIRNPWAKITLAMKNPDTQMTILHDLNVGYTI